MPREPRDLESTRSVHQRALKCCRRAAGYCGLPIFLGSTPQAYARPRCFATKVTCRSRTRPEEPAAARPTRSARRGPAGGDRAGVRATGRRPLTTPVRGRAEISAIWTRAAQAQGRAPSIALDRLTSSRAGRSAARASSRVIASAGPAGTVSVAPDPGPQRRHAVRGIDAASARSFHRRP